MTINVRHFKRAKFAEVCRFQTYMFDRELSGWRWRNRAVRGGILDTDDWQRMGRVPAHVYDREVPEWALSNEKCRQLLLHLYPKLHNHRGQRRRAARLALVI